MLGIIAFLAGVFKKEAVMAKYISRVNPVSFKALKRKPKGVVVVHHFNSSEVRFTRVKGGWLRQRTDYLWAEPEVVSSVAVARECNASVGCKDSWAKVY